ncbi:hypothetical protein RLIN73S_03694 [Rhodanobacter lindaniclasticus]
MFLNAYRVTRNGLRNHVRNGDVIKLNLTFTIHIDHDGEVFRA